MKKFFMALIIIFISLSLCGCDGNLNKIVNEAVSEVRYNLFVANSEEIFVEFSSGFREDPYVINGVSNAKKEFGVVSVKFLKDMNSYDGLPSFVLTINGVNFDREFELNPFNQTYVQDIETFVLDDDVISIKVLWGDFCFESELENKSKNFNLNHKDVLKIMIKEFKSNLKKMIKNQTFQGEIYVKIIVDPSLLIEKTYWYVGVVGRTGQNYSIIIDPISKQILAKKESENSLSI